MQKTKRLILENIFLLVVSILIFLVAFEIFVRIFYPQDLNYFKLDGTLEYKGIPDMRTTFRSSEFNTVVKLNDKGLRDYNHNYSNIENNYRILVLGDSMTFGYGVEGEEAYAKVLENLLNEKGKKYEVINAGVTGYNTNQELAFLEIEGLKYNPDLVVLGVMTNDMPTNNLNDNIFSLEDGKIIRKYPSYKFSATRKIRNFLSSYSHSYNLIKTKSGLKNRMTEEKKQEKDLVVKAIVGVDEPRLDEGREKTFLLLKEMKTLLDGRGIDFLVVLLPNREQVDTNKLKELLEEYDVEEEVHPEKAEVLFSGYLKKENIKYLALLEEFRKENKNNDFYYNYDGHFNKKGHILVAKLIYQKLTEEKSI